MGAAFPGPGEEAGGAHVGYCLDFGQCKLGMALSGGGEFVGSTFRFPDTLSEFLLSALLLELILSSGW